LGHNSNFSHCEWQCTRTNFSHSCMCYNVLGCSTHDHKLWMLARAVCITYINLTSLHNKYCHTTRNHNSRIYGFPYSSKTWLMTHVWGKICGSFHLYIKYKGIKRVIGILQFQLQISN
jgi:hypothetical protein